MSRKSNFWDKLLPMVFAGFGIAIFAKSCANDEPVQVEPGMYPQSTPAMRIFKGYETMLNNDAAALDLLDTKHKSGQMSDDRYCEIMETIQTLPSRLNLRQEWLKLTDIATDPYERQVYYLIDERYTALNNRIERACKQADISMDGADIPDVAPAAPPPAWYERPWDKAPAYGG